MRAPEQSFRQKIAYYIGLYGIYLKNYARRLIEYRGDTVVAMLGGFMMQAGFLIFLQVIYKRIPQLNGFTQSELLFLFGFVTLGREMSRMFLDSPFRVGMLIRRGQLDIFLIRPCSTLFQVVAVDVQVVAMGGAVVAIAVMGMALADMPHLISIGSMSWLLIAVLCNIFLQYAILMCVGTLAFRMNEVNSLLLPLSWLYEFNRYPITIFPGFIQGFLSLAVPFSIAAYFPVAFFLRPSDYLWVPFVTPAVTIGVVYLSTWLWQRGMRHYSSANA